MIFLQQYRLRSSTKPFAQSITKLERWWSSQSLQVNLKMGFFAFRQSQMICLTIQQGLLGTTGSSISPLMIQGVLNLVSCYPAALSKKKLASGCSCKKVEGISLENSPSILFFTIYALLSDQAIMRIFLALRMVSIPIVIAHLGTFSMPPKLLAASLRVILCRQTNRVMLLIGDGGSLNPICPVLPIPRICISMPPQERIFLQQSAQNFTTSSLLIYPLGILMFSLGISMWLKR